MRSLIACLFLFSAVAVNAQDAGQMAMEAAQQANDAAQQANQQALQATQTPTYCCHVAKPKFSVKGGAYAAAITVRMKDSTRGTYIYYTTDGWTPTTASRRYTGPVKLSSSATLQAIAVTPGSMRSEITSAVYTIAGSAPKTISTTFPANLPGHPVLWPGTPLPLVFTAAVTSKGLQVGDALPVALAQDLTVNGTVVASRLTPVSATVTQVDNNGVNGLPGTLTFEVHSLKLKDGTTVLLTGTETKDGQSHVGTAAGVSIIPLGGLFVRGQDAQIPAGASFVAHVRSDGQEEAQGNAQEGAAGEQQSSRFP
jgi:hypothetical protein